jgi:hypothetical protein
MSIQPSSFGQFLPYVLCYARRREAQKSAVNLLRVRARSSGPTNNSFAGSEALAQHHRRQPHPIPPFHTFQYHQHIPLHPSPRSPTWYVLPPQSRARLEGHRRRCWPCSDAGTARETLSSIHRTDPIPHASSTTHHLSSVHPQAYCS